MPASTPRGAMPYPVGSDVPDIDGDLRELAERVAAVAALYGQGLAADRPAASADRVGTFYQATDTGVVSYCTGSAWEPVGVSKAGGDTITASAATVVPLAVKGATSQTANLLEARDSAGVVVASVDSRGFVTTPIVYAGPDASGIPTGSVRAAARTASQPGLVVRGAASQSANLAEFQNSAGTVLARIDPDGYFESRAGLFVTSKTASYTTIVATAAASQTANIQEWRNSAGTVLASVTPTGRINVNAGSGNTATTATAGTRTLPSNPENFLVIQISGVDKKIPYYPV